MDRKQKSQPHRLAFLQGNARSKNELAKAQDDCQSNQKYYNYDPNNDLHRLPLRKWVSRAIVLRPGPANLKCWRFVTVVHSRQSGACLGRAKQQRLLCLVVRPPPAIVCHPACTPPISDTGTYIRRPDSGQSPVIASVHNAKVACQISDDRYRYTEAVHGASNP